MRIIYLFIIFSLLFNISTIVVNSQIGLEDEYGQKFKLKIGDSSRYKITYYNPFEEQSNGQLMLKNGSMIDYTPNNETIFSFTLHNISVNEEGNYKIYHFSSFVDDFELSIFNISDNSYDSFFISKAFDNSSIVDKYVLDLNNLASSLYSDDGYSNSIYREGDFIHSQYFTPYSSQNTTINWKTGWMHKISILNYSSNGTLIAGQTIEKIEDGLLGFNIDFEPILTIIALPIMGAAFIGGAMLANNLGKK